MEKGRPAAFSQLLSLGEDTAAVAVAWGRNYPLHHSSEAHAPQQISAVLQQPNKVTKQAKGPLAFSLYSFANAGSTAV